MSFRHLPPAGNPIHASDLLFWSKTVFSPKRAEQQFSSALRNQFSVEYSYLYSTGRAAMTVLLRALTEEAESHRDVVVIPSYTCYSVPASIIKAGLKLRVCDIDPKTLDYDYEELDKIDFSDVLCILSSNLYGLPDRLNRLTRVATKHQVFLVDDAAQSMGATIGEKLSGTFGYAGIFSLDKGKVITSMNGGIIVTNHTKLAKRLENNNKSLQELSILWSIKEVLKLFAYIVFLDPRRYWIPAKLPFLNLGETIYTTEYPIGRYNRILSGVALRLLSRLDDLNQIRSSNAHYYRRELRDLSHIQLIDEQVDSSPIYLRFPLLARNIETKNRILKELCSQGLGATGSFPKAVPDITELSSLIKDSENCFLGGRTVAAKIITLPTHPYVSIDDMRKIVQIIKNN